MDGQSTLGPERLELEGWAAGAELGEEGRGGGGEGGLQAVAGEDAAGGAEGGAPGGPDRAGIGGVDDADAGVDVGERVEGVVERGAVQAEYWSAMEARQVWYLGLE